MTGRNRQKFYQAGFTMIEVLVAVLVLAIGLLGVAGVQLVSMQQTTNSALKSEATMYVQSVAERLRSNGGDNLSATDKAALEAMISADLGAEAELDVDVNGDEATIELTWDERDPFADDGMSQQSLTLNVRL
ncbi:type IV pilus modification protein PilV [Marinobacter lutaoensis]|jgi:type IV pilus assembly protein PilV|uniref:Type IV pilus modification protein PilV n=1 Tax=Marinobacter lutaoensis TaxID=135739 RepID=A0A1V2DVU1_9GAMM|nr:type IV pilus modification protein PilV [Marinobacter lutaoensis]NVD35620.1 type IV pilus modification protein PilV [Marinobacter lutaoensis]ONF44728.1 type IV pilus modification protein PilV [Marinobacter lutaoensis]|tara:strand:- start:6194 stop:6589 length:396 start_codon:yes stop_codon:yes gene_type:complete